MAHTNKGSYGKLLIIAGSVNMSGAACFCAKAAYRMGSGLVRVFTCEQKPADSADKGSGKLVLLTRGRKTRKNFAGRTAAVFADACNVQNTASLLFFIYTDEIRHDK